MWFFGFTLIVILVLAILAVQTLRRRDPGPDWQAKLAGAGPEDILAELRGRVVELRSMPSLFRDEDYRWLRASGFPEAARRLRRQRVALAGDYLRELREVFEQAHALHERLSPGAETDRTAAAALRFRLRWTAAYALLPLNLWQLRLSGLASFGEEIAASLRALDRPAVSVTA